ncbi:MAG TPA: flagellar assembly peptidoglycan hydrolase FlgJ, partial [Gammaproteobacteria bacterium]|nr:flagellar assembly peptidoglycan hydrolase FlgJ [Gammaproteobacteria bacterium]
MDISDSGFYFDANGLSHLKREVKAEQTTENIRQVAQQFESLFLNQVLKSMREASPGTDIFASKSSLFYRDMLDKQLSVSLSSGGGIGLADVLVEQLTANQRSS